MNKIMLACFVCILAFLLPGCATKSSLKKEVSRIDKEVTTLSTSVEQAEVRLQEQDSRLADHDRQIAELSQESQEALQRAMAAQKLAEGKLLYEVTITDDNLKFDFDKAKLKPETEEILHQLVNQLKAENRNVYIEIQGHTDSVGPEEYNFRLGLERAESVRRYLSEAGIPLHRISTISYGEERPLAENSTKAGRSQNRRVVIQVLA